MPFLEIIHDPANYSLMMVTVSCLLKPTYKRLVILASPFPDDGYHLYNFSIDCIDDCPWILCHAFTEE